MCIYVCVDACHVCGAIKLEMRLHLVVSCLTWVLELNLDLLQELSTILTANYL